MATEFDFSGPYLPLKLLVRVWGLDAAGRPFTQEAKTESISPLEACVSGLHSTVKVNDILGLSYEGRKARFRVSAVRPPVDLYPGQIEVRALDASLDIWGIDFSQLPIDRPERRNADRFRCQGAISVWQQEPQYPIHAGVSDISVHGCYVDVMYPLPAGTKVSLALNISDVVIRSTGLVCTSHPALGMGVRFGEMSDKDRTALENVVAKLAAAAKG